jgi:hypothetical protein
MNRTLQDRLIKELRLRSISTMEDANVFAPEFIADYKSKFARSPRNPHDAHRPLGSTDDLLLPGNVHDDSQPVGALPAHHPTPK